MLFVRDIKDSQKIGEALEVFDFTHLSDDAAAFPLVEAEGEKLQRSMNLEEGPLIKTALFHLPQQDYLLIIVHHLLVDGVSWRVLVEDLNRAYGQLVNGQVVVLPAKTNSYRDYSEAMKRYSDSWAFHQEENYWRNIDEQLVQCHSQACKESVNRVINFSLPQDLARLLVGQANVPYHTEINDLLLASLGRSYHRMSGNTMLSINLEGHGREPMGEESLIIDRTVGWFTSIYPVILDQLGGDLRHVIRNTKERLHQVPGHGLGYNVMHYIKYRDKMQCHTPLCTFNYLGDFRESSSTKSIDRDVLRIVDTPATGTNISASNKISTDLQINCQIADNGSLEGSLVYDSQCYTDTQAQQLVDGWMSELGDIVAHTAAIISPEVTASDLGCYDWSDEEFELIYGQFEQRGQHLQRIYPLTPLQESMLLSYIMDSESTSYRFQLVFDINVALAENQWREVLRRLSLRQEVLRSSIIYDDVSVAQQAIVDRPLEMVYENLQDVKKTDAVIRQICQNEFAAGFDLQYGSLFRLVVMQTGVDNTTLAICVHHIITDGWSMPLILRSLTESIEELYSGISNEGIITCENKGGYEAFVREMRLCDRAKGMQYWSNLLRDYTVHAFLPSDKNVVEKGTIATASIEWELNPDLSRRLMQLSTAADVTTNTIIELAWGLLLQNYVSSDDVVFVKTVSGRTGWNTPVEDLVGLFLGAIPVRVHAQRFHTVREILSQLQSQAAESNRYDYCALSDIIQEHPLGSKLFQSQIVFENYPIEEPASSDEQLILRSRSSREDGFNELLLVVYSDDNGRLGMLLKYDIQQYSEKYIQQFIHRLEAILDELTVKVDSPLKQLSSIKSIVPAQTTTFKDETSTLGASLSHPVALLDDLDERALALEQGICRMFADALHLSQLDATTNLFSVGLTSIIAMRVSSKIKLQLKVVLKTKTILKTPVIRQLVHSLIQREEVHDEVYNSSQSQYAMAKPMPSYAFEYYMLTESQRGVYFDWDMNRDAVQYNIPHARKFLKIDAKCLQTALLAVVDAHPILKTRLAIKGGDVVQLQRSSASAEVSLTVLSYEPSIEFFQQLVRPFNLLADNLYRLEIYQSPSAVYLFYDFHHIVFDGLSEGIFMHDLELAYGGARLNIESYSLFEQSLSEEQLFRTTRYSEAECYFDKLLQSAEGCHILPSSNPDGEGDKMLSITIPSAQIRQFCRQHGVSVNSFFHASLACMLHGLLREETILFSTISNGRSDERLENAIGMFVKTLPVVSSLQREKLHSLTCVEAVKSMHTQLVDTLANDFYPYSHLVARHSIHPQILMSYQGDLSSDVASASPLDGEQLPLSLDTAKFPLSFTVDDFDDDFALYLEYDRKMYSEQEMQSLLSAFAVYSKGMTQNVYVSEVPYLSAEDCAAQLSLGQGIEMPIDKRETIVHAFLEQAKKTPEALAVADACSQYSYAELARLSSLLAEKLVLAGVKPGHFVGVLLERNKAFVVATLGIMRAGAAYLPIDTEYPKERRDYIVEDSQVKVLIDDAYIERFLKEAERSNSYTSDIDLSTADSLAYMIYTSGSTGKPKGVMIHHAAFWNFINVIVDMEHLTAADRIICHRSFAFDAHVEDTYPVLTVGGSIHIVPSEIRKDLSLLHDFIIDHHITGGGFNTAVVSLLLDLYPDLPMRHTTAGGEQLEKIYSESAEVFNVYGPTECTCDSTSYCIAPGEHLTAYPIGRPVANTWCVILDEAERIVPRGMAGELYIGGAQVGRGYWNRPELTEAAFVKKNLRGKEEILYRTGDLCRWDESGQLICLGRIDNQVKLRGYRIELGEIESVALQHPSVKVAVASICKNGPSDQLVLYYVLHDDVVCTDDQLRQHIEESSLAEYMHPTHYMHLSEMPMTPNGKINRKALPLPEVQAETIVDATTSLERRLYTIASQLLPNRSLGVTTNLISLGMNSIVAMRFAAMIHEQLGISVRMRDILREPTLRQVSVLCGDRGESVTTSPQLMPVVSRQPRLDYYPLGESMKGIYLDWEQHRDALQYNIPSVEEYPDYNAEALRMALGVTVSLHPYMKTRLGERDGEIVQLRRDEEVIIVGLIHLDYEPDAAFFQSRVRPFDLLHDRLYRIEVYQTPTTTWLFMDVHHIIFDGVSSSIFERDLKNVLAWKQVQPETYTAYDESLRHSQLLQSPAADRFESYIGQLLNSMPSPRYPVSDESGQNTHAQSFVKQELDRQKVEAYCRKHGLTAYNFFLTAFTMILHLRIQERCLAITTIDNGRDNSPLQDSVGMFVRTLPVVSKLCMEDMTATFAQKAMTMQEQMFSTQSLEYYSFGRIVERFKLHPEILFDYVESMTADIQATRSSDGDMSLRLDTVKVPLLFSVIAAEADHYLLHIEFDKFYYSTEAMQSLIADVSALVLTVVESEETLSSLSVVGSAFTALLHDQSSFLQLNGYAIRTSLINNTMKKIAGVKAVAMDVRQVGGSERLCVWFTADNKLDVEQIRASFERQLAVFQVPTFFIQVDAIPYNSENEPDVTQLQIPTFQQSEDAQELSDIDRQIFELVAQILGHRDFSTSTNLVSVGLTSIVAMRLSVLLKRQLGITVRASEIMSQPVICQWMRVQEKESEQRYELRSWYPLTENQRGVYLDWEQHREALQYNVPSLYSLPNTDVETVIKAVRQVIEAHPSIKGHLSMEEDDVVIVRCDNLEVEVPVITLETEPDNDYFQNQLAAFDLFSGPFYHISIYTTPTCVWLLVDIHHISYDGLSSGIFFSDLQTAIHGDNVQKEAYSAFDYALDQQKLLSSESYKKAEQYFDGVMEQAGATTFPHSSRLDSAGSNHTISVGMGKIVEIENVCRELSITPSSYFLSSVLQVLHALMGENSIMVSSINNGRHDAVQYRTIGMFVKTLPVTSQLDATMTFSHYSQSVHQQMMQSIVHDLYPYTHLVQRHGKRAEILYAYQGGLNEGNINGTDGILFHSLELDTVKLPIVLTVYPDSETGIFRLLIDYDESLYCQLDMEELASSISQYAISSQRTIQTVGSISLLSEKEESDILRLGAGKKLPIDKSQTFAHAFLQQSERTPEAVAVVDGWSQYTYGELSRLSGLLAERLVREGVHVNDFVCVMLDRRKEFVLSVLGIHRSGAAYVPIDPEYPEERRRYMLEDSQAKVLIDDAYIESFLQDATTDTTSRTIDLSSPDTLAYMIYTSGSTGQPKGAMLGQAGLWNFIQVVIDMEQLTSSDRIAGHRSFSFDAHIEDMYAVLTLGGSFHIMPSEIRKDLSQIRDFLFQHEITGGGYATAVAALLLNTYHDLPVRFMTAGGEKLEGVYSDHIDIINVYGPTECTDDTSYYIIPAGERIDNIPIGRPVANTWNFITDSQGRLLPRGASGELCIAGPQVGKGYWNKPDLTEKAFFEYEIEGQKVPAYRTGDLCRWNEEGELEYLSRVDTQVKLRGFRIELGEIEQTALRHENLKQVAAEIRKLSGIDHLVLYYSLQDGVTMDEQVLRQHMEASQLADYMRPDYYMQMDALPLTPNGKIDRRKLPLPQAKRLVEFVLPEPGRETIIAEAMTSLLQLSEPIGAIDGFLSMGGDSIKSIRLVSLLRQKGLKITVAQVLKYKTPRALAVVAEDLDAASPSVSQEPWNGKVGRTAITEWFFDRHLSVPSHYNQAFMLEGPKKIDLDTLHTAWSHVIRHHDLLRAVVHDQVLEVLPEMSFEILQLQPDCDMQAEVDRIQSSIVLNDGPLFCLAVFHQQEVDVLLVVIHHLLVDGVSWRILIEDLNTAYRQVKENEQVVLPSKTHSYDDYANALREYVSSYAMDHQDEYWQNIHHSLSVAGIDEVCDETECARSFDEMVFRLDAVTTGSLLGEASVAYNTEINDLLLTALSRSWMKLTGYNQMLIEMEGHGRETASLGNQLSIDRTIGWFTSIYPVVLEGLDGDMRHDIRLVKETLRRIPEKGFGYLPWRYLRREIESVPSPICTFNYLGSFSEDTISGNHEQFSFSSRYGTGHNVSQQNTVGTSLQFNCSIDPQGRFSAWLQFDQRRFTSDQVRQLGEEFLTQLREINAHVKSVVKPEVTASDLGCLAWNDTEFQYIQNDFASRGETMSRIYPMTPMQKAMLLKYQLEPESTAYRFVARYKLNVYPGDAIWHKTLQLMASKHEILRTAIIYNGVSEPQQAIIDGRVLGYRSVDVRGETDVEVATAQIQDQELHTAFELQTSPLFRIVCVRRGEQECSVIVAIHHIITDGWGTSILIKTLFGYLEKVMKAVAARKK